MKKGAKGALAYRPGQYDLTDDQRSKFDQLKANKGRNAARKYLGRQDRAGALAPAGEGQMTTEPVPTEQQGPSSFEQSQEAINTGIQGQLGGVFNRPNFAPSNLPQVPGVQNGFDNSVRQASDAVYDEFSRRNEPRFQQEQEAFRQRMYEQGVPEGSEKYTLLQEQMKQGQNDARQGAQNQAFQAGSQYQNQQFGQGLAANQNQFGQQYQQWGAPLEQLGALSPYYGTAAASNNLQQQFGYNTASREDTQNFTAQQAQADFERQKQLAKQQFGYQQSLQKGGYRPAGPESFDQWKAKQDYSAGIQQNQMFDNFVLQGYGGYPQQQPGFGGGFTQGFGAGTAVGIGGVLR